VKKKANSSGTRSAFVRSIDETARTLEAVASTEAVDSYGTILRCDAESIDLRRFNENPVLLTFHDDNAFPVGQCLNVRVEGGQLVFTASFDDITDEDRATWAKYKARTMRGFSVRFIATEQRTTQVNGRDVIEYTRWELLEISCVPIPANPEALRRAAGARGNMALKRSEMMKGLKAMSEGEGSDDEKKDAAQLYKDMGGDEGCKAAEEAESKDSKEPDGDEGSDEDKAKAARASEDEAEKEKAARAVGKKLRSSGGNVDNVLALQLAELLAKDQKRDVAALVDANAKKIPPALRAWALEQPIDGLRAFLKSAPLVDIRAAVPETGVRGDTQGTGDASVPALSVEESRKLDKILGINTDVAKVGFGSFDASRGAMTFATPTASQIRAAQAPRGKEG
jgi:HK97 family phage prohead protease